MKKYLITGGTGFVGTNLCTLFDNLNIEYSILSRKKQNNEQKYVSLNEMSLRRFDVIVHLAGRAHVINEICTNPFLKFHDSNVQLTLSLLQKAVSSKVKRFIYISSVGVYGVISSKEYISEHSPLNPLEEYAKSKYICEQLVMSFCLENNIEFVILRPPLIYGDYAPGNLRRLYYLCDKNIPFPFKNIFGHRSMLEVRSFCDAIYKSSISPVAINKIYNVADDLGVTTNQLVSCFKKSLNRKDFQFYIPKVFLFITLRLTNNTKLYNQLFESFFLDNKKIKSELNWKPVKDPKVILSKIKMD